jgi:hypothetical protein
MGYCISPYAVDFDAVTAAVGSKDEQLLAALVEEADDELAEIDELSGDFDEEEEEEEDDAEGGEDAGDEGDPSPGPTTAEDAIRHLIMGGPFDENATVKYGYAFEFVCRHFGDHLDNGMWSAMRLEWATQVDTALRSAGVPEQALRVHDHLMFRGPPVPLPEIESPAIGYLGPDEVRAALAALDGARVADIKDDERREAVEEVRGWLKTCGDSGRGLICFYA